MLRLSLPKAAFLLLFAIGTRLLHAQIPDQIYMWKLERYTQTGATAQKHDFSELAVSVSYLAGSSPDASAKLELQTPTGRKVELTQQSDGTYQGTDDFETLAAMDTAYPDGDYTLAVTTGAAGTQALKFGFLSGPTVNPVKITNFDAIQAWPNTKPVVKWESILGATYSDLLTVDVYDAAGKHWFGTTDTFAKESTSVEVTGIPINTPLLGQLLYARFSITIASGAHVYSGRAFAVDFPLTTAVKIPVITSQPQSMVLGSDPVTLSVTATGENLTYQWNGWSASDAKGSSFTTRELGVYSVTVSGSGVSVTSAPAVVAQIISPAAQQVAVGFPITLSVRPSDSSVQYQWLRDGAVVPGATSADYVLKSATLADAGSYTVKLTTSGSSVEVGSTRLLVATGAQAQIYAGTPWANSSIDGPRATATFWAPRAVTIGSSGDLYVVDGSTVRRIGTDGNVTTMASLASAVSLSGCVVADDGSVFVADSQRGCVYRIAPGGEIATLDTGSGSGPTGLAYSRGTLYVACELYHDIETLAADGTIATFAGQKSVSGWRDGQSQVALFDHPTGLAIDSVGDLWVADVMNGAVRRIGADGNVTTICGGDTYAPLPGLASAVRLKGPSALAFDATGNLYVACTDGLVRITPDRRAEMLSSANLNATYSIAVDAAGTIYARGDGGVIESFSIVPGSSDPAISLTAAPSSRNMAPGSTAVLQVKATGPSLTYEWLHDGAVMPGQHAPMLVLANVQAAEAGNYTVRIGNAMGSVTSDAATLNVVSSSDIGRLTNLSIRARAGTGAQTLIVGAGLAGGTGGAKPLLVRGIGPTLAKYQVTGPLAAPVLTLLQNKAVLATNAGWAGDPTLAAAFSAVQAFPLDPTSGDAAMLPSLPAGVYTIQVTGHGAATGVALAELYDADARFDGTHPQLVNVSARCYAGAGADVLIAGFGVGGATAKTVLIRGIGPTLRYYGVAGYMADPQLEIRDASGTIVASNGDWQDTPAMKAAFDAVSAFPLLEPHDAAILVTLPPGTYTAQVKGAAGGTGVALVEVYALP